MRISGEGQIGIGLALIFGVGAGAAVMAPDQKWIGEVIMAFSLAGLLALAIHHWWGRFPTFGFGRVPLQIAGRRMFEHMEARGFMDDGVLPTGPLTKLEHYVQTLVTQGQEGKIAIYGRRHPSQQVRRIPPDALKKLQPLSDGTLKSPVASNDTLIDDVRISRREVRIAIKAYGDLVHSLRDNM